MGRFLEPDPIGFLGGLNFYTYVGNNPVNFIDSFGMLFERIWSNKNERGNHKDKAITMMKFIKYAEGKSLNHLQHDMDNGLKGQRSAGGPESDYRYVINPLNSDEVMDMRHFLVVGPQGELAGLEIELLQLLGDKDSAFDAQDFLSNKMGADFFSEYDPSKELSYQLQKYFYGVIEKCGK